MKLIKILLSLVLICSLAKAQTDQPALRIIPAPNHIIAASGEFRFTQDTRIYVEGKKDQKIDFLLTHLMKHLGYDGPIKYVKSSTKLKNAIILHTTNEGELPMEAYQLSVDAQRVVIRGRDAGLLYAVHTFTQLLPLEHTQSFAIPAVQINDQPRFGYRGLMVDVARHFLPFEEVKTVIDLMAAYKLNRFHWHLTDDQGWRIEIKKYPKLTSVGAFRKDQVIFGRRELLDTVPYGGFYTQDQIREIVQYAAERFITVIPEIDIPAHSYAALRAYPEYKLPQPAQSADPWSYNIIYAPTEQTFNFLEDVFTEVASLFPGPYIHIGGDEANKTPWQESPITQKLMQEHDLKDVHGLQSYFIKRIEKFLHTKGKRIIGWDEILEGGLAPDATLMSWRNEEGGIAGATMNHDVIMVPQTKGLYLDFAQSRSPQEPYNIGGHAPLHAAYHYDPIPQELPAEKHRYILGVQANVWTEWIGSPAKLQYMLFPRLFALSEIGWTNLDRKDYTAFSNHTLPVHLRRLEKRGVNFRVPEAFRAIDTVMIGERFVFELHKPVPGSEIYYTVNGLTPGDLDFKYTQPISFFVPVNEKREIKTIVITEKGRRSLVTTTVFHNRLPLAASTVTRPEQGLQYKLYSGAFDTVDQLKSSKVVGEGVAKSLNLKPFKDKHDVFGVVYDGYLHVDTAGVYTLSALADDGMKLFIDNELVINNDFRHGAIERSGAVPLAKGFHKIRIEYFDAGEAYVLKVFSQLNNNKRQEIALDKLYFSR
ncbi:beta-N-acetylhexosaminidase [Sphingobacterium olei]|uniref:beta-N-acetylhexosaminidase n=1 Tax=Sphingobacterium olei TaxID=2571155 RepID=A0A4U0PK28_9SPHI|nr:family 20 glycosylhydrolase [Sphingobacterium olei]TJZ63284.1 beta-N-acetylhexosaminidase [Sphingobacterium olei]